MSSKPKITIDGNHQYKVDGEKKPSVTQIVGQLDKPALVQWAANTACNFISDSVDELSNDQQKPIDHGDLDTVIKHARSSWRDKRDKAADEGSEIHEWLEKYLQHITGNSEEPAEPPAHLTECAEGFKRALDKIDFVTLIGTEGSFYQDDVVGMDDFCGTYDAAAIVRNKIDEDNLIDGDVEMDDEIPVVIDFKTSGSIYPENELQLGGYAQHLRHGKESPIRKHYNLGDDDYGEVTPMCGIIISSARENKYDSNGILTKRAGDTIIRCMSEDRMIANETMFGQLVFLWHQKISTQSTVYHDITITKETPF